MSRVEGNMFFFQFFFLEKVIFDAINVIKTNKKNLKKQMAREHLLVGAGNPYHEQNTLLENTDFTKNVVNKISNVVKQE